MKKLTQTWKQQKNVSIKNKLGGDYGPKTQGFRSGQSEDVTVVRKRPGELPVSLDSSHNGHYERIKPPIKDQTSAVGCRSRSDPTKQDDGSFTSSFTDLDAEMLNAMEKMESDFKVTRTNADSAAKKCGMSSVRTRNAVKKSNTPRTKAQLVFDSPKQNSDKHTDGRNVSLKTSERKSDAENEKSRQTTLCIAVQLQKQNTYSHVPEHESSDPTSEKENSPKLKGRTPSKTPVSSKKGIEATSKTSARRKSPKDSTSVPCKRGIKKIDSPNTVHNISWESPQVASTPQATPNNRDKKIEGTAAARQTNLFKSLFTVQSPLNLSDLQVDNSSRLQNDRQSSDSNVQSEGKSADKEICKIKENQKSDKEPKSHILSKLDTTMKNKPNQSVHASSRLSKQESITPSSADSEEILEQTKTTDEAKSNPDEFLAGHERLELSNWGLPEAVLRQYHDKGIVTMFDWQAECLCVAKGRVLGGGNLVYSAPTSAGKTMVAELLVLKRVMETRRKAIIILPFVSVAREKMFYLQQMYQDAGIKVGGFMGSYSPAGGFSGVDVAVCTIEKGNSLINRLMEENRMDQLGIIVVDELHLVGDSHRGYLLELLLTKIRYVMRKQELKAKENMCEQVGVPDNNVQIVGMSATLPNLDLLAKWLNAELYHTDYRPVPLTECVKVGTAIYDSSLVKIRDVDLTVTFKGDEEHVIPLCLEMLRDGHSTLIFCPTKNWCEKLCETVAREFYGLLRNAHQTGGQAMEQGINLPLNRQGLMDVVEQLRRTPVGLDSMLGKTIPYGVAFHHAGLTFDERDIVEGAFRQGFLKVLVATSTLSSGVNLPARRVIVRSPTFHGKMVDVLTYKQMIGRAGRKGVDTQGESILICKPNERAKAVTLVTSELPSVGSCLKHEEGEPLSRSLKRAILEIVVSGVATVPDDVAVYASCTMLAASLPEDTNQTDALIESCIDFLRENEFVSLQKVKQPDGCEVERFCPSQLGSAVLASALSPDEGLTVFAELEKARQCFVLENELHIIYLVTPIYGMDLGGEMDWYQFYYQWEKLTPGQRRVAELVGVSEGFITKAIRGRIPTKTYAQVRALAIHKRFWTALMLHDLVQEMPLNEVARKYNCNKGQLQSLQQSAATFSGMVTVFCRRLGWCNLELILGQFQNRLTFGIQRELCDLVRLTLLNGQRARVLYNGGFQTVASLANANPHDVEAIFKNSSPFQSNKRQENESEWEAARRRECRCIWLTGRKGVTELEAAEAVIEEAKSLIQDELGGLGVQWKNAVNDKSGDVSMNGGKEITGDGSDLSDNTKSNTSGAGKSVLAARSTLIGPVKGSKLSHRIRKRSSVGRKSTSPKDSKTAISPKELVENSRIPGKMVIISPPELKKQTKSGSGLPETDGEHGQGIHATFNENPSTNVKENLVINPKATEDREIMDKVIMDKNPEGLVEEHEVIEDSEQCAASLGLDAEGEKGNSCPALEVNKYIVVTTDNTAYCDVPAQAVNLDPHLNVEVHTEDMFNDSMDSVINISMESNGEIGHKERNTESSSSKSNSGRTESKVCDKNIVHNISDKAHVLRIDVDDELNSTVDLCDFSCDIIDEDKTSSNCGVEKLGQTSLKTNVVSIVDAGSKREDASVDADFADSFMVDTQVNRIIDEVKIATSPPLYSEDLQPTRSISNYVNLHEPGENKHSHDMSQEGKGELLAAGNYERCSPIEDGSFLDSDEGKNADDSFEDLNIPIQNSQEVCLDGDVELPGQRVRKSLENELDMEDIAVAQEMSDTFGFTFEGPLDVEEKNKCKSKSNCNIKERYECTPTEKMDDSLTMSMVEKVLNTTSPTTCCDESKGNQKTKTKIKEFTDIKDKGTNNLSSHVAEKSHSKVKLSPGTLAFLDDLHSGMSPSKPPPKGKKNIQKVNPGTALDSEKRSRGRRKRKSDESEETEEVEALKHRKSGEGQASPHNVSGGSDCLPPTPPTEKTCNSPLLSFKNITPRREKQMAKVQLACSPMLSIKNKTAVYSGSGSRHGDTKKVTNSRNDQKLSSKGSEKVEPCNSKPEKLVEESPLKVSEECGDGGDGNYTERAPVIDPALSGTSLSQKGFTTVNVCTDRKTFDMFIREWKSKSVFSVSLACGKPTLESDTRVGIGANFLKNTGSKTPRKPCRTGMEIEGTDIMVVGLAVCWENKDSYYIDLTTNTSLLDLQVSYRLSQVQKVLENCDINNKVKVTIRMFDAKNTYSALVKGCGITPKGRIQDPKVACWLQDPGAKEKSLYRMVQNYLPSETSLLNDIGAVLTRGSLGMNTQSPTSGGVRAAVESVLIFHLMNYFTLCLKKEDLFSAFQTVEMPSVITLSRMELNGFGFSEKECECQKEIMLAQMKSLEDKAYKLAGRTFCLSSTEDVAQVLFIELQLPPDDDPSSIGQPKPLRGKKPTATRRRRRCHFSTAKDVLEKLKPLHPLPGVIVEWRRINNAITKGVYPLQREKVYLPSLDMYRIYTECHTHTATGRVTLSEPNLQNIPRDFEISLPDVTEESPALNLIMQRKAGNSRSKEALDTGISEYTGNSKAQSYAVSMRHAFIPFKGGVMLAGDYSQLELRIIAHLSQDEKLINILNNDGDVFKLIAAEWKGISPEDVSPQQRQQAKQICYGMIYGIGAKALGEQLEVDERDAASFIETFKARYPGMRAYLRDTVACCREKGYVESILGRRRYLPSITNTNPYIRAHAERQAVNTTVQGSASDLVKTAMNNIDARLSEEFPQCGNPHLHKTNNSQGTRGITRPEVKGCYLVLQLHDELIYEVAEEDAMRAAAIIKQEMENAMVFSVKMRVKIQMGPSWGKLQEIKL